jgi:hypothetical protein
MIAKPRNKRNRVPDNPGTHCEQITRLSSCAGSRAPTPSCRRSRPGSSAAPSCTAAWPRATWRCVCAAFDPTCVRRQRSQGSQGRYRPRPKASAGGTQLRNIVAKVRSKPRRKVVRSAGRPPKPVFKHVPVVISPTGFLHNQNLLLRTNSDPPNESVSQRCSRATCPLLPPSRPARPARLCAAARSTISSNPLFLPPTHPSLRAPPRLAAAHRLLVPTRPY